ncbi:MAG: hypothetical protein ACW99G_01215 [Candidatus Thorarchaeota archaeon]|jgi:hypothetical protein
MNYIKRDLESIEQGSGFESTAELLQIDFLKGYSNMAHFEKFVINKEHKTLIAIWKDGTYDSIGFLENIENINLPEWKAPCNYFNWND